MTGYRLNYDVVVEDEAELQGILRGDNSTADVTVTPDGTQVGEVCGVIVTGSLPAIVAWMEERAIDSDSLLSELADLIARRDLAPQV